MSSWSDGEIGLSSWNQGAFADYETVYIFVIDSDDTMSSGLEGYFYNGDFYTTGTSVNAGGVTGSLQSSGSLTISIT